MALQLGSTFPDLHVDTNQGKLSVYEHFGDGWGIVFSHPDDFTPVCTTELGTAAGLQAECNSTVVVSQC